MGRRRLRVSSVVSSEIIMLVGPYAKSAEVVGALWLEIFDGGDGIPVDYEEVRGMGVVNGVVLVGYALSSPVLGTCLMMDA